MKQLDCLLHCAIFVLFRTIIKQVNSLLISRFVTLIKKVHNKSSTREIVNLFAKINLNVCRNEWRISFKIYNNKFRRFDYKVRANDNRHPCAYIMLFRAFFFQHQNYETNVRTNI